MVRQVSILLVALALLVATCNGAQAATYDVYDGNPSNTYIQYFKDTLSKIPLGDHYVAFRSDQNEYTMVVGDISYANGVFTSESTCHVYTMQSANNYNGYYSYTQGDIGDFYLNPGDHILYSDLGHYPDLEERGQRYEILTTILIVIICVGYVVRNVFYHRPR